MLESALSIALSLTLGAILLTSAVSKLENPKSFLFAVLDYRAAPEPLARLFAAILPSVEFCAGLAFLTGTAPRLAAVVAALLFSAFLYAIGLNLRRGRSFDCHCSGVLRHRRIGTGLFLQDCLLLGGAAVLALSSRGWFAPATWSPVPRFGPPSLTSAAAILACAGLTALSASLLVKMKPLQRRRTTISEPASNQLGLRPPL